MKFNTPGVELKNLAPNTWYCTYSLCLARITNSIGAFKLRGRFGWLVGLTAGSFRRAFCWRESRDREC
jgi:hypothetical protein